MTTPKPYRSREPIWAMGPVTRENGEEIARWCDGTWSEKTVKITFYGEGYYDAARFGEMIVLENGRSFALSLALFEKWYEPVEASDDDT